MNLVIDAYPRLFETKTVPSLIICKCRKHFHLEYNQIIFVYRWNCFLASYFNIANRHIYVFAHQQTFYIKFCITLFQILSLSFERLQFVFYYQINMLATQQLVYKMNSNCSHKLYLTRLARSSCCKQKYNYHNSHNQFYL